MPRKLGERAITHRRAEVLALAAEGLSTDAIARRLTIERRTVQRHLQDAAAILGVPGQRGVKSRSAIVAAFRAKGGRRE